MLRDSPSRIGRMAMAFAKVAAAHLVALALLEGAVRLTGIESHLPKATGFRFRPMLASAVDNKPIEEYRIPTERDGRRLTRVTNLSENDPELIYRLKPDAVWEKQGWHIITNSLGLRDREIPARKPPDTIRILCLGDSVTFGWGLNENDIWPRLLEAKLNASGSSKRFRVINGGVYGYTSTQGLWWLRRGLLSRLKPDIAILLYGLNDSTGLGRALTDRLARSPARTPLAHIALYRTLRRILVPLRDRLLVTRSREASRDCYRYNLEGMVDLLRDQGVSPVLGAEAVTRGIGEQRLWDMPAYRRIALEVGKAKGLPFLDLPVVFAGRTWVLGVGAMGEAPPQTFFSDACHPNREGSRILADAAYDLLMTIQAIAKTRTSTLGRTALPPEREQPHDLDSYQPLPRHPFPSTPRAQLFQRAARQ